MCKTIRTDPSAKTENGTTYIRYDLNISSLEAIEAQRNLTSRNVTLKYLNTAVRLCTFSFELIMICSISVSEGAERGR